MNTASIQIPERGSVEVSAPIWERLRTDDRFWAAVERGLFTVRQKTGGSASLEGHCYVGRVSLECAELSLTEKVVGATAALIGHASFGTFRIEALPGAATDLGNLAGLLIHQFVAATRKYVSSGREITYRNELTRSCLASGRLRITECLKLRARGLRHVLAFERSFVAKNTLKNRILLVTLREIEKLSRIVVVSSDDLAAARGLSLLFSDCVDSETVFESRQSWARRSALHATSCTDSLSKDLLSLAAVVLAHESFELHKPVSGQVPRTWFLNLENLFQRAITDLLQSNWTGVVRPAAQRGVQAPLFPSEPSCYKANADLVLESGGKIVSTGDVKYKAWPDLPAASDLHELLAHAASLGARRAFLVYPHEEYSERSLGQSATGCDTWVFGLDVRRLREHVAMMSERLTSLEVDREAVVAA